MPADAFFSHVTAAIVWGIPLPLRALRGAAAHSEAVEDEASPGDNRYATESPRGAAAAIPNASRPDRPLDVAVALTQRGARVAGIRTHRLAPALTSSRAHGDLRVASPATTWAQLAEDLTVDELIVAGDAIVHEPRLPGGVRGDPGSGLATLDQLRAAAQVGRRIGVSKLREALPQIRVGSASPPETELRLALLRSALPPPELDMDILNEHGRPIGFTELAYPRWMILIEFEGDHHRTSRAQWNRDIEKHAQCVALGWTVLRYTGKHLYPTPTPAITGIRNALLRAGWQPGEMQPSTR